jgi:hypothetical protein
MLAMVAVVVALPKAITTGQFTQDGEEWVVAVAVVSSIPTLVRHGQEDHCSVVVGVVQSSTELLVVTQQVVLPFMREVAAVPLP